MGDDEDQEVEAALAGKTKTMPTNPLSTVIHHLRADLRSDADGMTDGELVARYASGRDEGALAAL